MLFYHVTDCVVTCKGRDIPKKKKAILQYEDKVYITFEDNVTEMELRYKRKRKRYYKEGKSYGTKRNTYIFYYL